MRQTAIRIATESSSVLLNLRTDCRPLSVQATGWFGGLGAGGVTSAPGTTLDSTADDRASLSCASESKWKLRERVAVSAVEGAERRKRQRRTRASSGRRSRARPRGSRQ